MDLGSDVEKKIKFDPKMETPQEYALYCNWVSFKIFFHKDPKALIQTFDLAGNTAIHVSTRSDDPDLIRQLLDMLPDDGDRRQALRMGNAHNNTLLHQVIFCNNLKMVETVLNSEMDKKLKKTNDDEDDLLELLNDLGETPLYRAAKCGRLRMLKHMAGLVDDMKKHFHRRQPKLDITSILHIAIIGQHFDVAVWLSKKEGIEKVAFENDGNKLTCLQLLSRMPSVFQSYNSHSSRQRL
ncbi:uncharacterized protein LOC129312330 [Prosopis cineraria]|uniref:uncharacterized protein LOC129312330 n=1 Tax=Prosopis cineraria TaxID=364024 RepID=UPI00240EA88D|nr:uncharacterized protein LOC129312330 [Prosopis cineraria]